LIFHVFLIQLTEIKIYYDLDHFIYETV